MLAAALDGDLPTVPSSQKSWLDGRAIDCTVDTPVDADWPTLVARGCPAGTLSLASAFDQATLTAFYDFLGFYSEPAVPLYADFNELPAILPEFNHLALGMQGVDVSPLQLALAAASISAGGVKPVPRPALSVNTPESGWVFLPVEGLPQALFTPEQANATADLLKVRSQPFWQSMGSAPLSDQRTILWYLGGTMPNWSGTPLVVVVLLEKNAPYLAEHIGQALLQAAQ